MLSWKDAIRSCWIAVINNFFAFVYHHSCLLESARTHDFNLFFFTNSRLLIQYSSQLTWHEHNYGFIASHSPSPVYSSTRVHDCECLICLITVIVPILLPIFVNPCVPSVFLFTYVLVEWLFQNLFSLLYSTAHR